MSSGGSKTQTVTQQQVADPWSGQQPYLTQGFSRAQQLLNAGGPQYYPGNTVTPFAPQTEQAMALTEARANAGSPLTGASQGLAAQTLGGQYLGSNPWSGRLYDAASQTWSPEASNQLSANMGGQYLNSNPYVGQLSAAANAQRDPATQAQLAANIGGQNLNSNQFGGMMYNDAAQGYQQQSAPMSGLMNDTLAGGYLGGNPYLDQTYNRAAGAVTRNFRDAVMPSLDASFGSAGRYGSGLHAASRGTAYDELGRSLEGLAGSMYGQNYDAERSRQMQAMGMQNANAQQERASMMQGLTMGGQSFDAERARQLQSLGMAEQQFGTDVANRMGAASTGAQVYGNERANQLQSLGLYGNQFNQGVGNQMQALGLGAQGYESERARQQQAMGLAPALAEQDYADIGRLAGVGSAVEQQAGNYLGGDIARYDYNQRLPWNTLGDYMGMIQGGYGGTTNSTSQQPTYGGSSLMSGLGGAASGASIGTAIAPGWGTAIGAGLGGLIGLFG